jgi:hypothetical protein
MVVQHGASAAQKPLMKVSCAGVGCQQPPSQPPRDWAVLDVNRPILGGTLVAKTHRCAAHLPNVSSFARVASH